jgi:hypothetical protein
MKRTGNPASVLARLLHLARERGEDHGALLNRFALERFLDRLARSRHADRFLLKGALLFQLWYQQPHRATRDADLLGFGDADTQTLAATIREIASIALDDAIVFDPATVRVEGIRETDAYGGLRVRLVGTVGTARCPVQIDVGFGDAVTPAAQSADYPTLLPGFTVPRLRVYPVYTVVAEKYQAMVMLGAANSRMKDFYDVSVIAGRTDLDGQILAQALTATFTRRGTGLPGVPPIALQQAFADDAGRRQLWLAFLARNRLPAQDLHATIALLHDLLWPPTQVAAQGSQATARWVAAEQGWR